MAMAMMKNMISVGVPLGGDDDSNNGGSSSVLAEPLLLRLPQQQELEPQDDTATTKPSAGGNQDDEQTSLLVGLQYLSFGYGGVVGFVTMLCSTALSGALHRAVGSPLLNIQTHERVQMCDLTGAALISLIPFLPLLFLRPIARTIANRHSIAEKSRYYGDLFFDDAILQIEIAFGLGSYFVDGMFLLGQDFLSDGPHPQHVLFTIAFLATVAFFFGLLLVFGRRRSAIRNSVLFRHHYLDDEVVHEDVEQNAKNATTVFTV